MSTSTSETVRIRSQPVQTRYDLSMSSLDLASTRLAVANAQLARALEGEMLLVRPKPPDEAIAAENERLLSWLGLCWRDASLDASRIRDEMASVASAIELATKEERLLRRILEDRALAVTHAILSPADQAIGKVAEQLERLWAWQVPTYIVVGETGSPNTETPTLLGWYQEQGYLPEALRTHLAASTCWATPPAHVDLAQLHHRYHQGRLSQATWHPNLESIQGAGRHAMREASLACFTRWLCSRLQQSYGRWHRAEDTSHTPEAWLTILADALRQEVCSLNEAVALGRFAFIDAVDTMTYEAAASMEDPRVEAVLGECLRVLTAQALATPERAKRFFQKLRHHFRDNIGLRGRQVMFPIRAALTGTMRGPCLGVIASLLGYDRCQRRLRQALCELCS